jgi:uncharacterized protein (DUF983 family)
MTGETDPSAARRTWPAILRGLRRRCPRCGQGRLFHHYLEQVDTCPVCHEPLARYQVGVFLPLVMISVVIFIIAVVMLVLELNELGNPLVYLYVLVPLCIIIPLAILPSGKGGIIGLLWAKGWSDVQDR